MDILTKSEYGKAINTRNKKLADSIMLYVELRIRNHEEPNNYKIEKLLERAGKTLTDIIGLLI